MVIDDIVAKSQQQEKWESSELRNEFEEFASQLRTLYLSGSKKVNIDWVQERLEWIETRGYDLWYELQEEKAKPKWIRMKAGTCSEKASKQ